MAKKHGIGKTAEMLGYSYAYIHQVLSGHMPVSRLLEKRLRKLAPRKYPPAVTVRYKPGDPRRDRALKLTMEQRRERLDENG